MYDVFLRYPCFRVKAVTLSYDDGVEQDEDLLNILNTYGLKATFNINSALMAPEGTVYPPDQLHRRLPESKIRRIYLKDGHEIALHSLHHKYMDQLSTGQILYELIEDRVRLERMTGQLDRGFAAPYGNISAELEKCLELSGIVYGRGVSCSMSLELPNNLCNISPSCRHNSPGTDALVEHFCNESPLREFHNRNPWLFYMWGHSYEFERDNSWQRIKELAKQLGRRDDVWYATNLEVFTYITDFRRLVYSADGTMVFNPTSQRIWLESAGEDFFVDPGKTVTIKQITAGQFVATEK